MDTNSTPTEAAERTQRHLAMLAEVADLTMTLVRKAAARAVDHLDTPPQDTPDPAPDPVLAFARLSRALRQTIALEARVAAAPPPAAPKPGPAHTPHSVEKSHLAAEALAAAKAAPILRRHNLARHIEERLDAGDVDRDIEANKPFAAILAIICRSLGIPFDLAQQPDENLLPIQDALRARQSPAHPAWTHPTALGPPDDDPVFDGDPRYNDPRYDDDDDDDDDPPGPPTTRP